MWGGQCGRDRALRWTEGPARRPLHPAGAALSAGRPSLEVPEEEAWPALHLPKDRARGTRL